MTFYFISAETAKEMYQDLRNMCGDDCLRRAQIFRRFGLFQEGRESLENDPRLCRPVSTRPNENFNKNCAILMHDRLITTGLFAESLGISKEAARQLWERDFAERGD